MQWQGHHKRLHRAVLRVYRWKVSASVFLHTLTICSQSSPAVPTVYLAQPPVIWCQVICSLPCAEVTGCTWMQNFVLCWQSGVLVSSGRVSLGLSFLYCWTWTVLDLEYVVEFIHLSDFHLKRWILAVLLVVGLPMRCSRVWQRLGQLGVCPAALRFGVRSTESIPGLLTVGGTGLRCAMRVISRAAAPVLAAPLHSPHLYVFSISQLRLPTPLTLYGPLSSRCVWAPPRCPVAAPFFLWLCHEPEHLTGCHSSPSPPAVLLPPAPLQELADLRAGWLGVSLRYCTLQLPWSRALVAE